MGDPKKGAQRLAMAGGINNFGTTIGPLLVSFAIFGSLSTASTTADISAVKVPYLILGAAFLVVAAVFKFSSIPDKIELEPEVGAGSSPTDVSTLQVSAGSRKSALSYPQLILGMIAIFLYVGVEVSTASNLPDFMKKHLNIETHSIAPFISLYWASLMIGRWTASVGALPVSEGAQKILRFLMPYIAFGIFLLVNIIANHDVSQFYIYGFVILAIIIGDLLSKGNPARQLFILSAMAIVALLIGIFADGMVSVYAFISVGLFCSTLWPCIFTLAVSGLGNHTNEGSGFLVMMIMGGGFISLLQGYLADPEIIGIQLSYFVGVACFIYLAFYAIRAGQILKQQGINFDKQVSGGH
jgi:FHS family L-fucose permease-like MFS transporter